MPVNKTGPNRVIRVSVLTFCVSNQGFMEDEVMMESKKIAIASIIIGWITSALVFVLAYMLHSMLLTFACTFFGMMNMLFSFRVAMD